MSMPANIQHTIEKHLGTAITGHQRMGGGDINEAARIFTPSDSFFVKWNPQSPPGMFPAEARGLELLASAGTLRVPQVIFHSETPALLVLEWLTIERAKNLAKMAESLGGGLAMLQQKTNEFHGLDHDNYIGRLPQPNVPTKSWIAFYRDYRIGAQMEIARQKGRLRPEREKLLKQLQEKLPQLLPDAAPSLLHGDLWGGNYSSIANDIPVIYDPAVYFGHREVEMAFTELFGGFPARFYEAYNAVFPLDEGYEERKALYQLYPLLVHLNHFGESYGASVDSITRRYVP